MQSVLDFLIISFSIFLFVKALTSFKTKEESAKDELSEQSKEEILLTEIRDILKRNTK